MATLDRMLAVADRIGFLQAESRKLETSEYDYESTCKQIKLGMRILRLQKAVAHNRFHILG